MMKKELFRDVAVDQVQVGMYVHLTVPWLDHPFATNSFKIKDEKQLLALRSLGLGAIQYDPARSEVKAAGTAATETDSSAPSSPQAALREVKRQRLERLSRQREAMARCEKTFLRAAEVVRGINKGLFSAPAESVGAAVSLVTQMLDSLMTDQDVALTLVGSNPATQDAQVHSLNVAALGMMLARALGASKDEVGYVGLGAIFHDIGKLRVPDKILRKTEPLTRAEKKFLEQHVTYGVEMARKLRLPEPVSEIIARHHEYVDGQGYPDGLTGPDLGPLSQCVCIANTYDNHCNPLNPTTSLTPYQALSVMFARQRGHFDIAALSTFIHTMGVYPPGTVVGLSNELAALVIAVNPAKTLKPTVLVYDPAVPKEDAIILDLALEPEIVITKSLRPSELSAEAAAYLNPRRRMNYQFDVPGQGESGNG